jgi:peptide chain release factor 2
MMENELLDLKKQTENPGLWNDNQDAKKVMKRFADLNSEIKTWRELGARISSINELVELGDESIRVDLEKEIHDITQEVDQLEINITLSGPYDRGNALLAIHAGAGGTDSQDWAGMLERMYLRWCENNKFTTEILDVSEGEEVGIKSVTIAVEGRFAFGYLKAEKGVHRLVRLSPFDAAHRRHTSFAMVEVLPDLSDEDTSVEIKSDDLRIDIFRSSSAGGQNVQKNATAVRITHLPTGIVVACQNERSQLQNRLNAMRVLRSRLLLIQQSEQAKQLSELRGEYTKAEWGSQIRSYVLHPYQMVKDHRTEYETGNTQAVLDGELNEFIDAFLRQK